VSTVEIAIPDLGGAEDVSVVEILVSAGQSVEADDGLVTLESDKASMDVPSTAAGVIGEVRVEVGQVVNEGDVILTLDVLEPAKGEDDATVGIAQERAEVDEADAPEEPDVLPPEDVPAPEPAPEPEPQAPQPVASGAPSEVREASDQHAETLVLGSGPGGYTAAFRAADLGRQVVLVERHAVIGGVCLNVGCIPSKALLHAASVMEQAASFSERGLRFGEPDIDLDKLRQWKDEVVGRLTGGLVGLAKQRKVEVVTGTGRFVSSHQLEVEVEGGRKTISFDNAIIAAGSRVVEIPGIPYEDPRVMDSTGALELADVPDRLLVIGGGIIGLEMATVYGALGSEITIVEMMKGIMPGTDRDLVRPLKKRLEGHLGARIFVNTKVAGVGANETELVATLEGESAPETASFDRVLVSVGRRPNSDRIGIEEAGIELDERGFIAVDKEQRTNVPHIFAIGDIVGQPLLAHKATHEGKVAAEVASGEKSAFDARVIPSVAYTDPEVAWVGLTEIEAKANGVSYQRVSFPWAASGRALGIGRDDGMTKLLVDPETDRVLGGGMVGPHAGDLVAELALAIEMDAEAADLALTIHPHPTLSETLAFAAEAYEGTLTDLYVPKRRKM